MLTDPIKYALAFGCGTLIIFFFAYRRIEQLAAFPAGNEFPVLKLLSAEALAGRRAYRRAFLYYCLLLLLIFIVICVFEPVAQALFASPVKEFQFSDVSWPLGAALFVVGILPATPLFDQIELAFRRFAHRAAGIPEGFLTSVSLVEQSKLADAVVLDDEKYADETKQFYRVKNIATAAGFSSDEARYAAQADLFLRLFYGWALSLSASSIWSAGARTRFSDVAKTTAVRATQLRDEIDQLIKLSLKSRYLEQLQKELDVPGLDTKLEPRRIRACKAYEEEELRRELLVRWQSKVGEISQVAKELIAIFVMLAANDDNPKSPDKHFDAAVHLAWRDQSKPLYSACVVAIVGGFAAALAAGWCISVLFQLAKGAAILDAIEANIFAASRDALNMAAQFGSALMVAFAIYYARELPSGHDQHLAPRTIPTIEKASLLTYAALAATAVSLIVYVSYQFWEGNLTAKKALSADLPRDILIIVAWSLVPSIFALRCTSVADLIAQGKRPWLQLVLVPLITVSAAFVLLVLIGQTMSSPRFWTSLGSVAAFSSVGMWCFWRRATSPH